MNNQIIRQDRAIEIIDGINIREVVERLKDMVPRGVSGYYAGAFLNLATGEVEYHNMNYSITFMENIRVIIHAVDSECESEIPDDDIAGDDPIPEGGVKKFPDYEERLLECLVYYATEGKDAKAECYRRIEYFYEY